MGVRKWFRLVRFSHTLFALPFGLLGMLYAFAEGAKPSWHFILGVLLCLVFARSAAMAYNRYVDRDVDAQSPRANNREIPRGIISPRAARRFTLICIILFWASTLLLNWLTCLLAPLAIGMFLGYTLSKRYTCLCHYWLGATLALAPLGGYIAVTGHFSLPIILLSLGVMAWVAGFDIPYSMHDAHFDKQHGLNSIPARFGARASVWIARANALLALFFFSIAVAAMGVHGYWGYFALAIFAGTEIRLQLSYSSSDLSRVTPAYMTTEGVNSLLFCALVALGLFF